MYWCIFLGDERCELKHLVKKGSESGSPAALITEIPISQHYDFPYSALSYPLLLPQILSLKPSFKFKQTQTFVSSK